MTAKGRAGVVVNVVADEMDFSLQPEGFYRFEQKHVARTVVAHHIRDRGAFRRAILHVLHIDVNTPAVEEETSVARRLVPVAIMLIDQPVAMILEEPVPDARQDLVQLKPAIHQTSVFRFQTCDASRHVIG